MKVHELSALTGVNIETIRKYRNQGMLFPTRLPNGYYDYSTQDLIYLLYIRKLRGSGLSLDAIAYTYSNDSRKQIYEALRKEAEELSAQIARMHERLEMLELTLMHFDVSIHNEAAVAEYVVDQDSYVIPLDTAIAVPEARQWLYRVEVMAQNILIDMAALQNGPLPERVPYINSIGTYSSLLRANRIPIPDCAVRIPAGTYLTLWLEPDGPDTIDSRQLKPLLDYAAAHGYRFTGLCTGFVFRIQRDKKTNGFVYRFRAQVEKAE